jgi:peroxiredoxin
LAEINGDLDRLGASLVAISVDTHEESKELAKKLELNFPLLKDEGLKTALAWGVAMEDGDIAVPAVFIISKDRKIVWKHVGEAMWDRPPEEEILNQLTLMP